MKPVAHAASRPARTRRPLAVALIAVLLAFAALGGGGVLLWRHYGGMPPLDGSGAAMPTERAAAAYPFTPSGSDADGDGMDDYMDILVGARADAKARPTYDDGYYQGGYPPADRGACTDLVWRAFREAGYDLKAMVDADIAADPAAYVNAAPNPDPNIDFRRTGTLDVFFSRYGRSLTVNTATEADKQAWQAGDIVIFEHTRHIGVVSDKRDKNGLPYILHNMGQRERENDYLAFRTHMTVTAHYRFDPSRVPASVLKTWQS